MTTITTPDLNPYRENDITAMQKQQESKQPNSILVNVNRCTGCWSCSLACKVAHNLDVDEYWQINRTIGGGQLDTPGGKWPDSLYMKWMPIWKQSCIKCQGESSTDNQPYCVFNCPMGALTYGDMSDPESEISKRADELRAMEFRVYQLPSWEDTRETIWYAEKDI